MRRGWYSYTYAETFQQTFLSVRATVIQACPVKIILSRCCGFVKEKKEKIEGLTGNIFGTLTRAESCTKKPVFRLFYVLKRTAGK